MKKRIIGLVFISIMSFQSWAQDTFSIVAIDSTTGEVGSAGASCVDLSRTSLSNDDFLGVLFPGKGAINSQAAYIPANQNNATDQMNLGKSPSEIIQWLVDNDVQNRPEIRQYGIVAMVDGSPNAAAHTGSETQAHTGHRLGIYYSIQGNILKGPEVLDSMELGFLNQKGDLACRLMAAMEGANMVGADSRCASNGTSSLFAFLKVAKPNDAFGSPSFLISVRTKDGDRIEPVDSLRKLFEKQSNCNVGIASISSELMSTYPNPATDVLHIDFDGNDLTEKPFRIVNLEGKSVMNGLTSKELNIEKLIPGIYMFEIQLDNETIRYKFIKN